MKEEFLKYKLNNMTLSDKIGQLFMIDYRNTLEMNTSLEKVLEKYNPGGFIIFKSNISNYNQTKRLINDIKEICNIPIIISVDQEGGRVQRLNERLNIQKYPPMLEIGNTNNETISYELGIKMGNELKNIGIDMNMAPVLDIYSNPRNTVISNRSFGTTSTTVSKMALAYAEGLKESNIIAIGKHFPGHGDTLRDSHINLPTIDKNIEELNNLEFKPFKEAIKRNIPGLMVAHIAIPNITKDNTPASLSKIMINNILRNSLNYKGLVITDSLKMKALSNYYTNQEIYSKCIEADNDILLMPNNIEEAYKTIYNKIDKGLILNERIDKSVYRILNTKYDYGLFDKDFNQYKKRIKQRNIRK